MRYFLRFWVIGMTCDGGGRNRADRESDGEAERAETAAKLSPTIQWEHSYFTGNKTFCIYLADD